MKLMYVHHRYGNSIRQLLIVAFLIAAFAVKLAFTPVDRSLLSSAISWSLVWIYCMVKTRRYGGGDGAESRTTGWAVGFLLGLATLCERAVDVRGNLLWSRSLLPLALIIFQWFLCNSQHDATKSSLSRVFIQSTSKNWTSIMLIVFTIISFLIMLPPYLPLPTIVLGLCSVLFTGQAYVLLDNLVKKDDGDYVAEDFFYGKDASEELRARRTGRTLVRKEMALKRVAEMAALLLVFATFSLEGLRTNKLTFHREFEGLVGSNWISGMRWAIVGQAVLIGIAGGSLWPTAFFLCLVYAIVYNAASISFFHRFYNVGVQVREKGALCLALADVDGAVLANFNFIAVVPVSRIWGFLILIATNYFLFNESFLPKRTLLRSKRMKSIRLYPLLALLLLGAFSLLLLNQAGQVSVLTSSHSYPSVIDEKPFVDASKPLEYTQKQSHPISHLIKDAEQDFENIKTRQSQTLAQAVTEYKRRYHIPPPPNFDKWYEIATKRNVQLIDEYDTIYNSLLPFWGLKPKVIRERAREALGFDNALIALTIRDGKAVKIQGGQEWQQKATIGMIEGFVQFLPDMDLAFNIHDEPRVIVPHEDLVRLVQKAKDEVMPIAFSNQNPRNSFSSRPADLNDGEYIEEYLTSRFNYFAHQATWTHSRMSCPPDTPSRSLEENPSNDYSAYAVGELGFIYNKTAFSDICFSPSLQSSYGFFDRPNAFNIVHNLFPVFSQSKISSFQDIIYPSPWYWYGKVTYDEPMDPEWKFKKDSMYWRGSTTGGFSRNGGWRRQHRQRFVQKINAPDQAKVFENVNVNGVSEWSVKEVQRQEFKDLFNVHFSHIGQCDPGDCDAQKEFFELAPPANFQDAWQSKYLVDVDGNAFSGRFYAFLQSKSLVYKLAIFREWHDEWIKPWVHYIPLSFKGDDYLESVRYFAGETEGKEEAPKLASQSREWARKVLRNEDLEVWFFRLLLEYGRLVDDDRESIGFDIARM